MLQLYHCTNVAVVVLVVCFSHIIKINPDSRKIYCCGNYTVILFDAVVRPGCTNKYE